MRRVILAISATTSLCCSQVALQSTAASYLIVDSLEAAAGGRNEFGGHLESDVVTMVGGVGAGLQDVGRVTLRLALKDAGAPSAPAAPSAANAITLYRYRVRYIRADGRNSPGVDVPYAFDGALTLTVADQSSVTFSLVRAQAKADAPLAALTNTRVIISTIAEVTFYGRDQAGREVTAPAWISIHFGDWADPR